MKKFLSAAVMTGVILSLQGAVELAKNGKTAYTIIYDNSRENGKWLDGNTLRDNQF